MKRKKTIYSTRLPGILVGLILFATVSAFTVIAQDAEEESEEIVTGFEAYSLIMSRNIFNPNRRAPRVGQVREPTPPQTERLEFVGSLIDVNDSENSKALFKSTEPEFQKAVKKDDTIAGFTVLSIGNKSVSLERDGESIDFEKGQQMTRIEEEAWQVAERPRSFGGGTRTFTRRPAVFPQTNNNRNNRNNGFEFGDFGGGGNGGRNDRGNQRQQRERQTTETVTTTPAAVTGASPADILRQLRERRERELE